MRHSIIAVLLFIFAPVVVVTANASSANDPLLWLEEVEGERAVSWAKGHNQRSLAVLQENARYKSLEKEVTDIVFSKDRLPSPSLIGGMVYNFWQDDTHVRGVWRRTKLDEYKKAQPKWEIVLDLDALSEKENENWVWKGADCYAPEEKRCMLVLSRGGKDAAVKREFDVVSKKFVRKGFILPESKARFGWVDGDTLLLSDDFAPEHKTDSGYPRLIRLWKRGTDFRTAPEVFAADKADTSILPMVFNRADGKLVVIDLWKTFFDFEVWALDPLTLKKIKINKPASAEVVGAFAGKLLFSVKSTWAVGKQNITAGSLVAIAPEEGASPEVIYAPQERVALEAVVTTQGKLYVKLLSNVRSRLVELKKGRSGWQESEVLLPSMGNIVVDGASSGFGEAFFLKYEDFITPPTIYLVDGGATPPVEVKRSPSYFDTTDLQISQYEATSRDRTKIPYFVVHKRALQLHGKNPTLLYGYGGFEIASLPIYSGVLGKVWLEKGGVYVVANIRGGGEFGPAWHQSALKENRQRAYDDFIAVAENLMTRKITSPQHLGIRGRSNGGLLMGVMLTQRPDLFNAIACQVPLLDMIRYTELPPGASWVGEYGDPADPKMHRVISKYSPYQNMRPGKKYPEVFFFTSKLDDRVHPGHARKLAAKMEEQKHPFLYYENMEGGHAGTANLQQIVKVESLTYSYLYQKLWLNEAIKN